MGCRAKDTDYAWAAGFIDGEGYFNLQPVHKLRADGFKNRKPRIEVAQTDPAPLLKLRGLFGGSVIKTVRRAGRKQAFRWDLTGPKVVVALRAIIPYLTTKRRQGQILLEYASTMRRRGGRITAGEASVRDALYASICAEKRVEYDLT